MPLVRTTFEFAGEVDHPVQDVLRDVFETVLEALLGYYDLPVQTVVEMTHTSVVVFLDETVLREDQR